MNKKFYRMGIDIGSTTAKIIMLDSDGETVFSAYRRHNTEILATLQTILLEATKNLGDPKVDLLITGSAGMGIAEKYGLPFIQEVVASAEVVRQRYPEVKTLIDIGGEDAKIIFFNENYRTDIRMNGSCAGGTGAFIDEISTLLNVSVSELDSLANKHSTIYPMASRCGVFAKTDLQNLLSRQVAKEDIAASVFHAVALQSLSTLAHGRNPLPAILFSGGPLTFMPYLRDTFLRVLNMKKEHMMRSQNSELLSALGAALADISTKQTYFLQDLISLLNNNNSDVQHPQNRYKVLFESKEHYQEWDKNRKKHNIEHIDIELCQDCDYFLGIDSGSTTTKIVLIDTGGRIACDYYSNNDGNSIRAAQKGLNKISQVFKNHKFLPRIAGSMVTGYGEDLIRTVFGMDAGIVETLAHFQAAMAFDKDVTFILDIGGQDMKAMFIKDGQIQNIEINEACSSGCGSFIESFARSMGYEVADFAQLACTAKAPYNLGTRCTVFMNSRVKQALREGVKVNDISAGLAYSIIKNALHKVLKITNMDLLGEHIVVQGGTFRNPAIHKALEQLIGKSVVCPDIAELMGAYGAALAARDVFINDKKSKSSFIGFNNVDEMVRYDKKDIRCKGCENKCVVTKLTFPNRNSFFLGNRCEKIYSNGSKAKRKGVSLHALKYKLLFDRKTTPPAEYNLTIGIPRVLNLFENFPFWNTLFTECGIKVHLSAPSNNPLYQDGSMYIMSENLCFPGKLVSGHIMDLIRSGVDRIFYPMVFYEKNEFSDATNTFNCPVVSGYPDVICNAIDPEKKYGIPLDMPAITFRDEKLLDKACRRYLASLGILPGVIKKALKTAKKVQDEFKEQVRGLGAEILENSRINKRPVILIMGRPYHIDPLINHNIPDLLTDFGIDVITEDSIPIESGQTLNNRHVVTQWEYVNRYFHAARWAGMHKNVELVQLNSFGCGPDPFILDEVRSILAEYGKNLTVIRIDEIESTGSIKLRLRSMIESLKKNKPHSALVTIPRKTTKIYQYEDRSRTLIIPDFSPFCSPPITRPFIDMGYQIARLPSPDQETVDVGLKYTNNEICYPGIICIGGLVKALQSGKYDLSKTAIGFSQTGGQCRATSYPSMIKKALIAAGFDNVPVVTLSTNLRLLNDQPGFKFNIKEYIYKAAVGTMFTDALSDMYHSTVIKENSKGATQLVIDKYLNNFMDGAIPLTKNALLKTLKLAIIDFNNIDTSQHNFPKVGIVGEIYVKYNAFSNNYVAQWLIDQGIEVVMPSFFELFTGGFVTIQHSVKTDVKKRDYLWFVSILGEKLSQIFLKQFDAAMQGYRYYRPRHNIKDIARKAEEILSLNHQYGEGWLIAGETASFASDGIQNVLCLQPFGCIANHVIAKGVQKKLQNKYPDLNLLFLDVDAGVSEVNFFNRMHFFIDHAKSTFYGKSTIVRDRNIRPKISSVPYQ